MSSSSSSGSGSARRAAAAAAGRRRGRRHRRRRRRGVRVSLGADRTEDGLDVAGIRRRLAAHLSEEVCANVLHFLFVGWV